MYEQSVKCANDDDFWTYYNWQWKSCQIGKKLYITGGEHKPLRCSVLSKSDSGGYVITERANMGLPRNEHAACTYLERYIIVSGSEYTNEDSAKTVEMYDTGNNRWERLPDMITPRWGHGSCTAGEKLYVFCGRLVGEGAKELNSIEVLNLRTREDGFIEFQNLHNVALRAM